MTYLTIINNVLVGSYTCVTDAVRQVKNIKERWKILQVVLNTEIISIYETGNDDYPQLLIENHLN